MKKQVKACKKGVACATSKDFNFDKSVKAAPLATEGVWPESYEIRRDAKAKTVSLRTRFYEVTHDLKKGGAISSIVLFRGTGKNMLVEPISCEVTSADWASSYSDVKGGEAKCEVRQDGDNAIVTIEAALGGNPEAAKCPVKCRTTYEYRWGYIRIRREFMFPEGGYAVAQIMAHEWKLRPDINRFGVRAGTPANDPTYCGECHWGRLSPGRANDYPYWSSYVPRHVVMGNPGREGLEWFVSSDLAQWTHGVCGEPGHGWLNISTSTSPRAAATLQVSALRMPRPDLQRKQAVFSGTVTLDYRIGIPIISGRAHKPFLHASFTRHDWPTEARIKAWADGGVRTAHFHHDGDTFHDGLFWRDGVYPPFGPEDMAEFDRVLSTCRKYGIRATTYFSNKELHPTAEPYKKHGQEWARLPDGVNQVHNLYMNDEYGAQMCLRSGWSDWFKKSIERVCEHHELDGLYYDWNQAIYCNNPAHSDRKLPPGAFSGTGGMFADMRDSAIAHWDIDELIELMEWSRKHVGPDGMLIIHNTMNPCMATENFADYVIGLEWGSGKLLDGVPRLRDLPFEWNFVGSRSRGLITGGCVEPDAPEAVYRKRLNQCLLTGVSPWRAEELDWEVMGALSRLDLSKSRFLDWRNKVADAGLCGVDFAAYDSAKYAVLIAANSKDESVKAKVCVCGEMLQLRKAEKYSVTDIVAGGKPKTVTAKQFFETGLPVEIAANSSRLLRIEPAKG